MMSPVVCNLPLGFICCKRTGMMGLLYGLWFKFLALLKIYAIGLKYILKEFCDEKIGKRRHFSVNDLPVRTGCVAIVTGGTDGIGLETVYKLLSKEMHVIIGTKLSPEECLIKEKSLKNTFPQAKVEVQNLDLKSMSSVKSFADDFLQRNLRLHLLVNNAGIMCTPHLITKDGFEEQWAVNYLSHSLLTRLLLPRMAESGTTELCSRIVFVTSSVHFVGFVNFDDLHGIKHHSPYHSYLQSKLAIVLMTYQLQKYVESKGFLVTVNCLHPGIVNTHLYKYVWWASFAGPHLFKTPSAGAETVVYASLAMEMEGIGGKYLEECSCVSSSRLSYDLNLQSKLRSHTWMSLQKWL